MLFKPNTLIYLQRSGLLLTGRRLPATRMAFADDIVKNLEVLQKNKLISTCQQFFAGSKLHGRRILIVLDASIVFDKTIELDQSGKPDLLLQAFVDAMPFEPGKRACLGLETGATLRVFATNADLYGAVAEALHMGNAGKVLAVTPAPAYNLSKEERTVSAATERFLSDTTVLTGANFLTSTPA